MTISLPPRIQQKKPRRDNRIRSASHLKWIRGHACCVLGCQGMTIEAAHVRSGTDGGTGLKPGDNWAISLCSRCHHRQHSMGEMEFETRSGINMKALAQEFWRRSPYRSRVEAKLRKAS